MGTSVSFNGTLEEIVTIEELGEALSRFDQVPRFELWLSVPDGPSMSMLRTGENAWLMYLRHEGDGGFTSVGRANSQGTEHFLLSNGQEDEYPLAWCVELEQCYKAVAYFYVNDGARPEWIQWHET